MNQPIEKVSTSAAAAVYNFSDRRYWPAGLFPRLAQISVYAIGVERITGKRTPLPAVGEQWPALDRSATPDAVAPDPHP